MPVSDFIRRQCLRFSIGVLPFLLFVPQVAGAAENPLLVLRPSQPHSNKPMARFSHSKADLRGWDYIASRMVDFGVEPQRVVALFTDRRMPKRDHLYFSVTPREPRALYRGHNTKATRQNALRFYKEHAAYFEQAEELYGVPQELILSILQIESRCGQFTGRTPILYRLARLASAADPQTIKKNQTRYLRKRNTAAVAKVAPRAQWLESTFLPHALATLSLADRTGVDPLELRGSPAGAIGMPQFLPGNLELHGADADMDGRVNLFVAADAIFSVARFLTNHGWDSSVQSAEQQKEVLMHYNRSASYVETVLAMANALKPQLPKQL